MFKETITYTDYNGKSRTEEFLFHLTKTELLEMELNMPGGFEKYINDIIESKNMSALIKIFKEVILKAYGKKSEDGRRFIKSETISTEFAQTEAYDQLFIKFATDAEAAANFINGLIPADLNDNVVGTNNN